MGKKANHESRKLNQKKDKTVTKLEPMTRTEIVNLHRRLHKATFKKKAPKAVKQMKELAFKTMFTRDNRVDPELNKEIWRHGIRNTERKIRVTLERKKNEDDEAADSMYTIIRLAK